MMFILTALICMAMTAQAQTVYVSTGSDAVAYHKNKSCSYLKNSKDVKSISTAEAKRRRALLHATRRDASLRPLIRRLPKKLLKRKQQLPRRLLRRK